MRREELESKTKQELSELARKRGIERRSLLSKDGLIDALLKQQARNRTTPFEPRRAPAKSRGTWARAASPAKPAARPAAKPARPPAQAKPAAKGAIAKPAAKAAAAKPAAKRPARESARTAAPDIRRERSGPFGPAAESLHGGSLTPPAGQAVGNGRPSPRAPLGSPLEMPAGYGRDFAGLMVRDPYWLHAYWEIMPDTYAAAERELGDEWHDHRKVMRVFSFPAEERKLREERADRYDVELPPDTQSWYLNVPRPNRAYRVVIGIRTRTGKFRALVRSNDVCTPRDSYSHVTDEEWTTPPEAFRHLYESGATDVRAGRSSAELGLLLRERLAADWSSGMLGSMASGMLARPEAERGFWFVLDAELIVYGATEPDATVTVQGRNVALRPDGTFSLRFLLPDGTQVIDATALSADGVFRKTITPTVRRETNVAETVLNGAES